MDELLHLKNDSFKYDQQMDSHGFNVKWIWKSIHSTVGVILPHTPPGPLPRVSGVRRQPAFPEENRGGAVERVLLGARNPKM